MKRKERREERRGEEDMKNRRDGRLIQKGENRPKWREEAEHLSNML